MITSILEYASGVWRDEDNKRFMNVLQVLQNKQQQSFYGHFPGLRRDWPAASHSSFLYFSCSCASSLFKPHFQMSLSTTWLHVVLGLACFSSPSRHHLSVTQVPAISTGSQRQTPIPILSLSSALGTLSVRNTVRSNLALCFTFTYTSTSFLVKIPDNFKLPPCTTHPRYRCRIRSSTPIQYNYPPDNKTCFLIHCHHYFHQPFQNKATKIVLDQPLHMFRVLKDSAWTSLLEPCPSVLKRARLSERLVLSSPGKGLRGRQPSILTLSYPETFPWQVT